MWNGKHTESETFKSPNSPEVNYRIKTVLSRVMWFHSAFLLPLRVLLFLPSPRKKKKKKAPGCRGPGPPAPSRASVWMPPPSPRHYQLPALGPVVSLCSEPGRCPPHTLCNSARFCFSSLGGRAPGTQQVRPSVLLLSTPLCPGRSQGREQSRPGRQEYRQRPVQLGDLRGSPVPSGGHPISSADGIALAPGSLRPAPCRCHATCPTQRHRKAHTVAKGPSSRVRLAAVRWWPSRLTPAP